MNSTLQVGVTGGIGSGKSLVCKIFSTLGIPVYNADKRARWLMNHDKTLQNQVRSAFGTNSYGPDGTIDRNYLAEKVFKDPIELNKLNALVHPAVGKDYNAWTAEKEEYSYLIKEAALMFESGSHQALDFVINVSAPEEVRIQRVLDRDAFRTRREIEAIIDKQLPGEERIKRADFVIKNDDHDMVLPQVLQLHQRFLEHKKSAST